MPPQKEQLFYETNYSQTIYILVILERHIGNITGRMSFIIYLVTKGCESLAVKHLSYIFHLYWQKRHVIFSTRERFLEVGGYFFLFQGACLVTQPSCIGHVAMKKR